MPRRKDKKFYNFSFNEKNNETDFYLYGEIISGGNDWKFDETDVTFQDMRDTLDSMEDNSVLNMYINSPGGSVFCTQGMISMLERAKDRGITINSYIDGLGASCASWLPMIADNLYIYSQSILMIHKPMTCVSGNSNEMKAQIEILDKIENDVIIPLYMSRAKEGVTEEDIRSYMEKETWFTSKEILEIFDNITLLEDKKKKVVCCVDRDVMKNYINMPDNIKNLLGKEDISLTKEMKNEVEDIDTVEGVSEEPTIESSEENEVSTIDTTEGNEVSNETEDTEEVVSDEDTEDVDVSHEENQVVETENEPAHKEDEKEDGKVTQPMTPLEPGIVSPGVITPAEQGTTSKDNEEEEENIQKKLEKSNEIIIALNDKIQDLEMKIKDLEEIADKYNAIQEEKNRKELENKIEEKSNFYRNKFERIGALDKFESDEVQNLIKDCVSNNKSLSKLNEMLVDMIIIEDNEKVVKANVSEVGTDFNNLIPTEDNGLSSLFE